MIKLEGISKTFKVPIHKWFLKREYKTIQALDDINLEISEGEIVGYIGVNGAGKSTTIKILSGILYPDKGKVSVNGIDPFKERKKNAAQIGVVFGQRSQLWWDLPVSDSYSLLKDIYKIPKDEFDKRLAEYVELFELEEIIKSPVRLLSLGQRVRCDIVASLLHNPKVLFLDEPTIGLDAYSKIQVRNLVKEVNKKYKTTVILTTHDMSDIEQMVSRVVLIGHGKLLYDGSLKHLKKDYGSNTVLEVIYQGTLKESSSYKIVENHHEKAVLEVYESLSSVITELEHHVTLVNLDIKSENIDDIIFKLYEDYKI